jgi:tRNA modification GTPase
LTGEGIEDLRDIIHDMAIGEDIDEYQEIVIFNVRHKIILEQANNAVIKAIDALKDDMSREFIAVELKEVIERLGEITGAVTTDDILERIFSQFCIGK